MAYWAYPEMFLQSLHHCKDEQDGRLPIDLILMEDGMADGRRTQMWTLSPPVTYKVHTPK